MNKLNALYLAIFLFTGQLVFAHEIRPAYLQVDEVRPGQFDIFWKVPRMGELVPGIKPAFGTCSLTETSVPLASGGAVIFKYHLITSSGLHGMELRIDGLSETMIDVLVRIKYLDGQTSSLMIQKDHPSILIPARSSSWTVISSYTTLGIEHILFGFDHLLFVLALIIITHGAWSLLKTITAFTLAHSITLSLAVLGYVHFPAPPVEAVIALSIVFLAVEIIRDQNGIKTLTARKPWLVAFTFGLLHGFGFAGALSAVGLPQQDIPLALGFFNVGVELGQIAFILFVLSCIRVIAIRKQWPKWVAKVPAYAIGGIASFWLIDRVSGFFI